MSATPEEAAAEFLAAWQRRDWPAMLKAVQVRQRLANGVDARRLEGTFGMKRLQKFTVGMAREHTSPTFIRRGRKKLWTTPEAVRIPVAITYRVSGRMFRRRLDLVVTREGKDGYPAEGSRPAEWGVNDVSAVRESPL